MVQSITFTLQYDPNDPSGFMVNLIQSLRDRGLTVSVISQMFGVSRATLYNRYISPEVYQRRKAKHTKQEQGTRIVVTHTQASTRRKAKKKDALADDSSQYWTREEILTLMRLFGTAWKNVAATVKKHIKKESKSMAVMERLAKEFTGKPVGYICKSIINGAYYKAMNAIEEERWQREQRALNKPPQLTPEEIQKSDERLRDWMVENGKLWTSEMIDSIPLSTYEIWQTLKCAGGTEAALEYFHEKGLPIPKEVEPYLREYMEIKKRYE